MGENLTIAQVSVSNPAPFRRYLSVKIIWMIHSILWRIPSFAVTLMVLAPAVWSHFDHHLIERYPNHSHLRIADSHTHNYNAEHSHSEGISIGVAAFTNPSNAVIAHAKNTQNISQMDVRPVGGTTDISTNTIVALTIPKVVYLEPAIPPPRIHTLTTTAFELQKPVDNSMSV